MRDDSRLPLVLCAVAFATVVMAQMETTTQASAKAAAAHDVVETWPEVAGDLQKVTWAHAVNSQNKLDQALEGPIMMLEADVSLGVVKKDNQTAVSSLVPIMAHPPDTTSDLSLESFLKQVIDCPEKKGVKLDFKSVEALEQSLPALRALEPRVSAPVWLNADVVPGPGNVPGLSQPAVDAKRFLQACVANFPSRTLSLGWTTRPLPPPAGYEPQHVAAMVRALRDAGVRQPVTFAVRASLAARSAQALQQLLSQVPESTLTLWGAASDEVDEEALQSLIVQVGFDKVYVDLPEKSGSGIGQKAALPLLVAGVVATAVRSIFS